MFFARKKGEKLDIWPGFVDALATVLMAIIFVLMTFVISQLYLTEALNQKENDVSSLNHKLKTLEKTLQDQEKNNDTLEQFIKELKQKIYDLTIDLKDHRIQLDQKNKNNHELLNDSKNLEESVLKLTQLLKLFEANHKALEQEAESLRKKFQSFSIQQFD